jgi:disulfide oxidoreductase YuzD
MGFWPAPFYTGCQSLANATTQSNTYSWSGSFLHRHFFNFSFSFSGMSLVSKAKMINKKKWNTSQNW